MPHENSVFHSLLKHLPWDEFERLVEAHGADKRQRGFTAKTHLVAMICTQLCGTTSLRDIEAVLSSHAAQCYHLGIGEVRRSSLAEANRRPSSALFTDFLAVLMKRAHRGLRRKLDGRSVFGYLKKRVLAPLRLVDLGHKEDKRGNPLLAT